MAALIVGAGNRRLLRLLLALTSYRGRRNAIFVARGSRLQAARVVIGHGTRINGPCIAKGSGALELGRYCAVGHDVKFITSNHLTTPVNLNLALQRRVGAPPHVDRERLGITIGHNVWIGDNAILLPGVTVGNGAIIGAGAVIAKAVAPYTIVVGSPARAIRKRFGDDVIELLEQARWWDWSPAVMARRRAVFDLADAGGDIEALRRALGDETR